MLRNNINIAIVAMVKEKEQSEIVKNECFNTYNYTSLNTFNETLSKPSEASVEVRWIFLRSFDREYRLIFFSISANYFRLGRVRTRFNIE